MLRDTRGLSRNATALILALSVAAPAAAEAELELPAPSGATSVRAVAVRAELSPRPDGAYQAVVSVTVLNPETQTQELRLAAGPGAAVSRAGEPVRLKADGSHALRLEASEVAVVTIDRRVAAGEAAFLAAEDAGWIGRSRGPLLQPVRRLRVSHPAGSAWSGAALEIRIEPGGQLLACSLMASSGALADEDGSVSWSFAADRAPEQVALAWPAIENETFLPVDAREAADFEQHWSSGRSLSAAAVRLVRSGILVVHGEGLDDEAARRAFEPARRPGWAPIPGPPTRSEREAAAALAAFADRLELRGAPRVAAATPERRPTPPPPTPAPTPAEPKAEPAPRPAAQPPARPAARRARAETPAPDLDDADMSELVRVATDSSWRSETLLQTESSVPATAERARRWARRALRGEHGVSRAVLARESVPALHGKTWGPGFVSEFFGRKSWYRPDPDFSMDALNEDERRAHDILDDLIGAIRDGRELRPEEPAAQVAQASPAPAAPAMQRAPASPARELAPSTSAPAMQEPAPAAAAPAKPAGPPVPWLQNPAQARIFVFREKARGLDRARIALAIATVEARHGKPFAGEPAYRDHFGAQDWYRPREDYGPEQLSIPARETITLLRNALDSQSY